MTPDCGPGSGVLDDWYLQRCTCRRTETCFGGYIQSVTKMHLRGVGSLKERCSNDSKIHAISCDSIRKFCYSGLADLVDSVSISHRFIDRCLSDFASG